MRIGNQQIYIGDCIDTMQGPKEISNVEMVQKNKCKISFKGGTYAIFDPYKVHLNKCEKTASGNMKIKLSKSQWQAIGKKAGWMKTSRTRYHNNTLNIDGSLVEYDLETMMNFLSSPNYKGRENMEEWVNEVEDAGVVKKITDLNDGRTWTDMKQFDLDTSGEIIEILLHIEQEAYSELGDIGHDSHEQEMHDPQYGMEEEVAREVSRVPNRNKMEY